MMGPPVRAGRAASRYFRRRDFYAQAATAVGHSGFTFLSGPEGTEEIQRCVSSPGRLPPLCPSSLLQTRLCFYLK